MKRVEEKYKEIVAQIKLYQNGAVSELMEDKSKSDYTLNFGVSVTTLRDISSVYYPDSELAIKLWDSNFRETKLLSTLIVDSEYADYRKFVPLKFNLELIEQISFNYLCKLKNVNNIINEYLSSNCQIKQTLGMKTLALLIVRKQIESNKIKDCLNFIVKNFSNFDIENNLSVVYNLMTNISLVSDELLEMVSEIIEKLENSNEKKLLLLKTNLNRALLAYN
jgi:hypothetical protein